ncbi:EF hand, partial [Oesophagostomum dentatum]
MRFLLLAILYYTCYSAPVPGSEEDCDPEEASVKEETYEEKFLRADKNRDKKLDFSEFLYTELPYVEAKRREFKMLDKNGDGFVSKKEYNDHYLGGKDKFDALRIKYLGELFEVTSSSLQPLT